MSERQQTKRTRRWWLPVLGTLLLVAIVYIGVQSWVGARAEAIVRQAGALARAGDHRGALDHLQWLIWLRPDHAPANLLAGRCQLELQNPREALDLLRKISVEEREYRQAGFLLFSHLLKSGDLDSAEKELTRYVEQFPDDTTAAEELYWLFYNQWRNREAERLLQQQLAKDPASHRVLLHLLNLAMRPQLARESLPYLESVEKQQPGQPEVLATIGWCRWQLGDSQAGVALIERALAVRPNLRIRTIAAEAYLETSQLQAAKTVLGEEPADHDPYADRWHWLQSRLAEREGDHEAALGRIEHALRLRPTESAYWHHHGTLLRLRKRENASASLRRAAKIEGARRQLNERLMSGILADPPADVCQEVSHWCEQIGMMEHAKGWASLASRR